MLNNLLQMQLKLKATSDLIGNKIAAKITRASKYFPKNNSESKDEDILREIYISLED